MKKKTIAVLFGGCSTEYEVSLKSAASVIDHLDRARYHIVMVGITREGRWLKYHGTTEDIRQDRWHAHPACLPACLSPSRDVGGLIVLVGTEYHLTPVDAVFPVLHGKNGEDGTVQGLLELSGLPFVGCGTLSSAIGMDKAIAHTLVRAAGIETAESVTIYDDEPLDKAVDAAARLGFPLYVKPARSGSSLGITKACNKQELMDGAILAFSHDNKIVIEQNVNGFEVGCAVMGDADPIVGEVDEIELRDGFFNYHEKYTLETSAIHMPARIDADTAASVKAAALTIYRTLGCRGLARVDLFLTNEGRIVFNEVNTMPGFTSASRYPNMLRGIGLSFPDILDQLIQLALAEERSA